MKTDSMFKVDAGTGERIPFSKEELEHLHLGQLNAVLRGMSSHQIEAAIAEEFERRGWTHDGWRSQDANPVELYNARQRALQHLAETEMARHTADAEAQEAALGTPDERARARVLRIHAAKLAPLLATMTAEQRAAWDSDVAICRAGIASAQVRKVAAEVKIFTDRLAALGALPPVEGDLEALLEPELHAWGIDGAGHEAEVARLKAKHGLDDDLKPRTTTRKRAGVGR